MRSMSRDLAALSWKKTQQSYYKNVMVSFLFQCNETLVCVTLKTTDGIGHVLLWTCHAVYMSLFLTFLNSKACFIWFRMRMVRRATGKPSLAIISALLLIVHKPNTVSIKLTFHLQCLDLSWVVFNLLKEISNSLVTFCPLQSDVDKYFSQTNNLNQISYSSQRVQSRW